MLEECAVKAYDEIALDANHYNWKDICTIVDGSGIIAVLGNYVTPL